MIKAPLSLLSEKLNRLNFFISHTESEFSGLFMILAGLSSLSDVCLKTHPTSPEGISGQTMRAAVLTQLRILPWLSTPAWHTVIHSSLGWSSP